MCGLFVAPIHAARILNLEVESKLDREAATNQFELLFDPGETAVELEVFALEFKDGAVPPLSPIASNNPATRAANGQYVAKTVVEQENRQRVQKVTLIVPLNELKLTQGLHQIAYQVRVLQDGKPVEHVCAPTRMVSVGKVARVTSQRMANVTIKEIKPKSARSKFARTVNGQEIKERKEITVRVPVPRQVRQQVPQFEDGSYSEVFAFAPLPKYTSTIRTSRPRFEEMQNVPWTPPRAIRINFATTRNVGKAIGPRRDAVRQRRGPAQLRHRPRGYFGIENTRRAAALARAGAADAARQLQGQPDFQPVGGRFLSSDQQRAVARSRRRAHHEG